MILRLHLGTVVFKKSFHYSRINFYFHLKQNASSTSYPYVNLCGRFSVR